MKLSDLNNLSISKYYDELVKLKGLTLVENVHKVLNSLINYAVDNKIGIDSNPIENNLMKKLRLKNKRVRLEELHEGGLKKEYQLSTEDIAYIFKEVKDTREEIIYHLQILHGLRIAEALAVRFEHIDFENNVINIKDQVTSQNLKYTKGTVYESDSHNVIAPLKTESSFREIPLIPGTKKLLIKMMEKMKRDTGLVYTTIKGTVCGRDNWNHRHFRPLMKKLNLDIKTHQLRKFFGSYHIMLGTSLALVSKWLGHADKTTTLKHYIEDIKEEGERNKWVTQQLLPDF